MERVRKSVIVLMLALFFASFGFSQSVTTECTTNSTSPACQNPVFADDQDKYLFDLTSSQVFNSGTPSKDSVTLLHGGEAGNGESGILVDEKSDTVSGDTKKEYFIQGGSEAGTGDFGRGSLESSSIDVSDGLKNSDQLGEYLVNPPHTNNGNGMCGDGFTNTGGDSTTCPQDYYLPKNVSDTDGYSPSWQLQFDERQDTNFDFTGGASSVFPVYVDGEIEDGIAYEVVSLYPLEYKYYKTIDDGYTDNTFAYDPDLGETAVTEYTFPAPASGIPQSGVNPSYRTVDVYSGSDATNRVEICTELTDTDLYTKDPDVTYLDAVAERGGDGEYGYFDSDQHSEEQTGSGDSVEVQYAKIDGRGELMTCSNTEMVYTGCSGNEDFNDCNSEGTKENYFPDLGFTSADYAVSGSAVQVYFPDYKVETGTSSFGSTEGSVSFDESKHKDTVTTPTSASELFGLGFDQSLSGQATLGRSDYIESDGRLSIREQEVVTSSSGGSSGFTELGLSTGNNVEEDRSIGGVITGTDTRTVYSGSNATGSVSLCTVKIETDYYSEEPNFGSGSRDIVESADYYNAADHKDRTPRTDSSGISVDVKYSVASGGTRIEVCDVFQEYGTGCSSSSGIGCSVEQQEYYTLGTKSVASLVSPVGWSVSWEKFDLQSTEVWNIEDDLSFDNVTFSGSSYPGEIRQSGSNDFFAVGGDGSGANDASVSFNEYYVSAVNRTETDSGQAEFYAFREDSASVNPDGPTGRNNGIVAYNEDDGIVGSTQGFLGSELLDGIGTSYVDAPSIDCPGDQYRCIATVDVQPKESGWTSPGDSYQYDLNVESVRSSAGACETYNNLAGAADNGLHCSEGPNFDVCGAYENRDKAVVRGPDVNTTAMTGYSAHREACIDTVAQEGQCVLPDREDGTRTVDEGYVANLAAYYNNWNYPDYTHAVESDYQAGEDAPDSSVCLDIDDSTAEGGWYNLDNQSINGYLRERDSSLVIDVSENGKSGEAEGASWVVSGRTSLSFSSSDNSRVKFEGKNVVGETDNLSVSTWIKPSDDGWVLGQESGFGIGFDLSGNNRVTWKVHSGSGDENSITSNSLADGDWHHVVGAYNSNTGEQVLYIDGSEVASASPNYAQVGSNIRNFCIGEVYCGGGNHFGGQVDDTRIYNRSLSGSGAQFLEDNRYSGLGGEIAWWEMNNGPGGIGLTQDRSSGSSNKIDYFYGENPTRYHPDFNPKGGKYGTSLLSDCGPLMTGCGNDGSNIRGAPSTTSTGEGTYFAFFENNATITEYNPVGEHSLSYVKPYFDGQVNKIKAMEGESRYNSQLGTDHPDTNQFNAKWFEDTNIGSNNAVQYAYTKYMNWSIASSGVPYPPFGAERTGYGGSNGAHYRVDYSGENRTTIDNESVPKTAKAFGNSLAVVAQKDIPSADINKGEGFWIDPDDVKDHWEADRINSSMKGASSWRDLITFDLDISGPDAGIGYDLEEGGSSDSNPGYVDEVRSTTTSEIDTAFADIYWERNSPLAEGLEPPVCGDDSDEYLLEEQGESANSIEGDGKYACTTAPDQCVSYQSEDKRLYDIGEYQQAGEPGEEAGRLKDDDEICDMRDNPIDEERGTWYDQDFAKEYCRANGLYGPAGVQWMEPSYIDRYPNAVNEGIDDDLNPYLEQNGVSTLESNPETYESEGGTPVTAGEPESNNNPKVATKGFCAGDDASEYIIVQDCRTDLCETDNSNIGVANDPDKCLLDQSETSGVSGDERDIYQEGEKVEVNSEVMACFGGEWWDEWPIQFLRDEAEAPIGQTDRIAFTVINPQETETAFDLELGFLDTSDANRLDSRTFFEETGTNEMNITVGPSTSATRNIVVRGQGLEENISKSDVTIMASSRDGGLSGTDTAKIGVFNLSNVDDSSSPVSSEPRDVPGMTIIQAIWLTMIASVIYFFSGRNI